MQDPSAYGNTVANAWSHRPKGIRSFWQSPIVMREINRRITGDGDTTPVIYFREHFGPADRALSLGSGEGQLEREFINTGAARQVLGVDISPDRVARANARAPKGATFVCEDLERWHPDELFDLIICKSVLHHIQDLEGWCSRFPQLAPGGLLYLDDFVGASRFQWSTKQIALINRLLACLPDEFKTTPEGVVKREVRRPDLERFIARDPSEAVRSAEILDIVEQTLEPLEVKRYGGGIFGQLFSGIMGNFVGHDELVRVIMEVDAIVTEEGILPADKVWGVYRIPPGG